MKRMLFVAVLVIVLSVIVATSTEAAPVDPPKPQNVGILFLEEKGEIVASVTVANLFGKIKVNRLEFATEKNAEGYCIALIPETQWAVFTVQEGYHWQQGCKNGLGQKGYRLVPNNE